MDRDAVLRGMEDTQYPPKDIIQTDSDPCAPGSLSDSDYRHDIMLTNLHLQDVNPVICGQQYCKPGNSYGYKIRSYYVLHYIVSGCGIFVSHNLTHHISRGQIFVIRPEESTFYKADDATPWQYRWVGFTSALDLSEILSEDVIPAPECEYIFRGLMDSARMENDREYFICSKIYELLSLLAQRQKSGGYRSQDYVLRAKNFIEANYCNGDISVQYIADSLHLDRSYFSSLFHKYMGMSPHQYIELCRLQKAAELLSHFSYSTSKAAMACGYTSIFNFSKMFKKMFGVCPSHFGKGSNPATSEKAPSEIGDACSQSNNGREWPAG